MRALFVSLMVILGIAAIAAYLSLFMVHQTQQAMVLEFGAPKKVIAQPGLNWKIPLIQNVEYFDKRVLEIDLAPQQLIVAAKKRLVVDAFARYKIVDPLRFFQTLRTTQVARQRIEDQLNANLRQVFTSSSLDDIVRDKRDELVAEITKLVNADARGFGIDIIDVRIKRADLPEEISKDVFNRMRTERQREASQYRAEGEEQARTIRAQADREVIVIKALATQESEKIRGQGDAIKNEIFADAFGQDPDFFAFYRSMQAYVEGLKSNDTRMVISPDTEFFRYFKDPLGSVKKPSQP